MKNIIRIQKDKDNPYVMLDKTFLSDNELSWKAKGLLAYLLSKPDDWTVVIEDLIKKSIDGEKSVRAGMDELKNAGYVKRYPVYSGNKIAYWQTVVLERPNQEINQKQA